MQISIGVFWVALAVIVGVAANTRGRHGLGWFTVAVVLSPLIAGLLLMALPRGRSPTALPVPAFEPEGVLKGIPYRSSFENRVDAMMAGGLVRFRDMAQFHVAAEGRDT